MNKTILIKIFAAIVLLAILVAVIYYIVQKLKEDKADPTVKNNGGGSNTSKADFPLQFGSTGQLVKDLQGYLNFTGSYNLKVDGAFGAKTENAVLSETSGKTITKEYYDAWIAPWKIGPAAQAGYSVTGSNANGTSNG